MRERVGDLGLGLGGVGVCGFVGCEVEGEWMGVWVWVELVYIYLHI